MENQYALKLDDLIKRAQNEPGIADLFSVYGQYEEVIEKSQEYLAGIKPKTIVTTTAESS